MASGSRLLEYKVQNGRYLNEHLTKPGRALTDSLGNSKEPSNPELLNEAPACALVRARFSRWFPQSLQRVTVANWNDRACDGLRYI